MERGWKNEDGIGEKLGKMTRSYFKQKIKHGFNLIVYIIVMVKLHHNNVMCYLLMS